MDRTDLSLSEVNVYRKLLLAFFISISGLGAAQAASPSYTVGKGDTAYSLSKRFGLSVDRLLSINHLSDSALEVGQVLVVAAPTYTVSKGETAYSIARKNGLSVDALLSINGLSDPHLEVGQVLNLTDTGTSPAANTRNQAAGQLAALPDVKVTPAVFAGPVAGPNTLAGPTAPLDAAPAIMAQQQVAAQPQPQATIATVSTDDWFSNAQSLLGVPYVWGAKSRSGTDCSGFVLQVFGPLGLNLPRTSAAQAQVGQPVTREKLQRGDLVFFDTEGRGRVTHVGIALGGNEFINANSYAGRVAIDDLGSRYWASRYVGARRVLGVMAMANAMH